MECGNNAFSCWNGTCIDSTKVCDGKRDCSDGLDEEDFHAGCSKSSCSTYDILKIVQFEKFRKPIKTCCFYLKVE